MADTGAMALVVDNLTLFLSPGSVWPEKITQQPSNDISGQAKISADGRLLMFNTSWLAGYGIHAVDTATGKIERIIGYTDDGIRDPGERWEFMPNGSRRDVTSNAYDFLVLVDIIQDSDRRYWPVYAQSSAWVYAKDESASNVRVYTRSLAYDDEGTARFGIPLLLGAIERGRSTCSCRNATVCNDF